MQTVHNGSPETKNYLRKGEGGERLCTTCKFSEFLVSFHTLSSAFILIYKLFSFFFSFLCIDLHLPQASDIRHLHFAIGHSLYLPSYTFKVEIVSLFAQGFKQKEHNTRANTKLTTPASSYAHITFSDKTRQDNLFNSAQLYQGYRLEINIDTLIQYIWGKKCNKSK